MSAPVGIATLHRAPNFGAFLQAFGLQQRLRQAGVTPRFLDLATAPAPHRRLRRSLSQLYRTGPFFLRQAGLFRQAVADHLEVGGEQPEMVFVGSDEVWNVRNPSFQPCPEFYGLGLDGARFCAYAPSMGQSEADDLARHPSFVDGLRRMHRLSGRDTHTVQAVMRLTGREVPRVVDPTFLIDWDRFAKPAPVDDALVVYTYALAPERVQQIQQLAARRGWRIVTPGLGHDWADLRLACDPFQFIGLLRSAPAVLTDTFHGTIFSVLMGARFGILGPVRKNKLNNLIAELGLADRVVESEAALDEVFERPPSAGARSAGFAARVDASASYLRECLSAVAAPRAEAAALS